MVPAEIALLDRHFAQRTARWPEIHATLLHRLILRSRQLSLQSAINAIPTTQQRLEPTLWQLAYRFGRVTPRGLEMRVPISHAQLAEIVAAQRPSVTIALARLEATGSSSVPRRTSGCSCGPSPAHDHKPIRLSGRSTTFNATGPPPAPDAYTH